MYVVRRLAALAAGAAVLLCILPAAGAAPKRSQTEERLKEVQAEIARAHARTTHDQAEVNRVTRELKNAEISVGTARAALAELQSERAQRVERRAQLAMQKRQREAEMAADRAALAGELRAAYLIGGDEPLKLLLNQQDPARTGRMFAYYSYFGRARAEELARIAADVQQLDALDAQLAGEEQHLAELESQQSEALGRLEEARSQRRVALASLEAQSRTHEERLQQLQQERAGLETLLRRLRLAIARQPPVPFGNDAFSRLRGQLLWPVAGRIEASFGQARAGGLKWDGVLIDTVRGAPVRAVYQGRVIFADWLPGLGLLMIIDHGGGYLSLYGHNERLYKKVGDPVSAGDPIASAGDSGGSPRPELYFEIRRGDRPIDPRPWFRSAAPAG